MGVQNDKQFKRQTTQPDFNAPPYAPAPAQKENPTIWYSSEQKEPLHVKIGNDLKGLVGSIFPPRPSNLFQEDNTIDTGAIRDTRDSAYGAPEAPASSYGAPAVAYEEPAPAYGAPAEPAPAYGAPEEPAPAYGAPAYEAEDVFNTMLYGSEEKLPLLIKVLTDFNKVFDFYAGQGAQMAAFYAPALIPYLRNAGFDVKRIRWVPELIEKLKPTEEDGGYGAPVASYGEPAIAYGAPVASYGEPAIAYEEPEPAYGAPAPAYEEPAPSYNEPAPSEPIPVYHAAPENSYAAPDHYAPPGRKYKRTKKQIKKNDVNDVTPDHHDELLTAVPALELLKLKKKLNRKEAREKIDQVEERVSRQVDNVEDPTSRLKETLEKIEEIVEAREEEMSKEQ